MTRVGSGGRADPTRCAAPGLGDGTSTRHQTEMTKALQVTPTPPQAGQGGHCNEGADRRRSESDREVSELHSLLLPEYVCADPVGQECLNMFVETITAPS